MLTVLPRLALATTILLTACKDDGAAAPKTEDAPASDPVAEQPATKTPTETATPDDGVRSRLMAWLDPEAVSLAWIDLSTPLRGDTLAVVYGLPPRAEDLLQAVNDVDRALEAVRPPDAPKADTWLHPTALVSTGRFARRPTVLRPLRSPVAEVRPRLEALELRRQDAEVFEVWEPQRVFPYRVVLLEGDVAAFIPASEPGSGLTPLATARDMPPSDVQDQLDAVLGQPGAPSLALFASGPMLHLDLDQDVLALRFELRQAGDGSLDGHVALQIDGDAEKARAALEGRTAPEQRAEVRALVDRAAYALDGELVQGRLQLPASDAAVLHVDRG